MLKHRRPIIGAVALAALLSAGAIIAAPARAATGPDLALTSSTGATQIAVGGSVDYHMAVSNIGDEAALNASMQIIVDGFRNNQTGVVFSDFPTQCSSTQYDQPVQYAMNCPYGDHQPGQQASTSGHIRFDKAGTYKLALVAASFSAEPDFSNNGAEYTIVVKSPNALDPVVQAVQALVQQVVATVQGLLNPGSLTARH